MHPNDEKDEDEKKKKKKKQQPSRTSRRWQALRKQCLDPWEPVFDMLSGKYVWLRWYEVFFIIIPRSLKHPAKSLKTMRTDRYRAHHKTLFPCNRSGPCGGIMPVVAGVIFSSKC